MALNILIFIRKGISNRFDSYYTFLNLRGDDGCHILWCIFCSIRSRYCERLIPTTSPKVISNHTKFLEGWCNYLDWCQQFILVRISAKN